MDTGGEVFVADSRGEVEPGGTSVAVRSRVDRLHWLEVDVRDPETNEYFAALSSDLGPLTRSARDVDVPIRVVDHTEPVDPRGVVAPFVGARLRDWAARCLVSPYGYLYTRVSDFRSTPLRTADGDSLQVAEIGSITPDPANVGGSVLDWLTAQARDRRIEVRQATSLAAHRVRGGRRRWRRVRDSGRPAGRACAPRCDRRQRRAAGTHGRRSATRLSTMPPCGYAWSARPPAASAASSC